jgi:hypothetical protein
MAEDACARLRNCLKEKFREAFDKDLDATLKSRQRDLWILGVDTKRRCLIDVCGTIDAQQLAAINSKGFWDTDAGFKADAHKHIPTGGKEVDVFLLNTDHFESPDSFLGPLVVHELAHYLEQIGETPNASDADRANAGAVLVCLKNNVRAIHTPIWAQHLAIGARRMVVEGRTPHKTIREFLEAAVPPYDRNGNVSVRE